MKVKELLKKGIEELIENGVEETILKARMWMAYILKVSHEQFILQTEKELTKEQEVQFFEGIKKLIKGIPIQYLIQQQSFCGLDFYVDENVLIPQPDTEILVEEVIKLVQKMKKKVKILDMCTGSGAIGVTLAKFTNSQVMAVDVSRKVLEIAQKNVFQNQVKMEIVQSDMFEKLSGKFDVIVSNPPYIETETIKSLSQEVQNEPRMALDGGEDGLKFYRILADKSREYLLENGVLAVEIGFSQKEKVIQIFEDFGFCDIYSKKDFGNQDRIVVRKMEEVRCHFHLK